MQSLHSDYVTVVEEVTAMYHSFRIMRTADR